MIIGAILGSIGGLARSSVGISKAIKKKEELNWRYWGITIITSVIIGVFVGILFSSKLSLLAGYAGTDLVENMYKFIKR